MNFPDGILATLAKMGFITCFGLPGEPVLPLWNAFQKQSKINLIMARQENNMIWMADASMKINKLSFVLCDGGPGIATGINGLATASGDRIPLLCIVPILPGEKIREGFQSIDYMTLLNPVCKKVIKWKVSDDTNKLLGDLIDIWSMANSYPSGPVVILIEHDLFFKDFNGVIPEKKMVITIPPNERIPQKALELLQNSERPLIIAGWGCREVVKEVLNLGKRKRIPYATTNKIHNLFPNNSQMDNHPEFLGFSGHGGSSIANYMITRNDIMISLGCGLQALQIVNPTIYVNRFIIYINLLPPEFDPEKYWKNRWIWWQTDVKQALPILNDILPISSKDWQAEYTNTDILLPAYNNLIKFKKESNYVFTNISKILDDPNEFTLARSMILLRKFTKGHRRYRHIIRGVGGHSLIVQNYWDLDLQNESMLIWASTWATIGYGLPAAIGVAYHCPDDEVWLFVGDGDLMESMNDLIQVSNLKLNNLKIFIVNNRRYCSIALGQISQGFKPYNIAFSCEADTITPKSRNCPDHSYDFALFGKSAGIESYNCFTLRDFFDVVMREVSDIEDRKMKALVIVLNVNPHESSCPTLKAKPKSMIDYITNEQACNI
ncbi:MAG: acetolactate synthase large subunit [Hyperionvirus sp.]|uniref:Acetolactate synthase large subunit n=1 Tax=Hyperionvirus sp. TaxID=2487770 RepID=A0A3G5AD23_9VIRU|nr:MAG: acetolactate synthase large subunit [Hyperionvirus sp.]